MGMKKTSQVFSKFLLDFLDNLPSFGTSALELAGGG